jgi:hypothetical protein
MVSGSREFGPSVATILVNFMIFDILAAPQLKEWIKTKNNQLVIFLSGSAKCKGGHRPLKAVCAVDQSFRGIGGKLRPAV